MPAEKNVGLTVLLTCALAFQAEAVDLTFPEEQFGAVDLIENQSTKSVAETLGALTDRFELMSDFREDDPYRLFGRPIGRLDILAEKNNKRGVGSCTAALIATDKIITNYHCIPGTDGSTVFSATIRLGYLQMGTVDSKSFEVNIAPLESDQSLDYTILQVYGDPGTEYGSVKFSTRHALDNEQLFIIHHPGGMPQRLTRAFCRSKHDGAVNGAELRHLCDTLPGSSGSLVFAHDRSLVGIHHSGGLSPTDTRSFNRATDAISLYEHSTLLKGLDQTAPGDDPPLPPATGTTGWIFLGRYMNGGWSSPRSDHLVGYTPEEISGMNIVLSVPVNVRKAPFRVVSAGDTGCDIEETPKTGSMAAGNIARIVDVVRLPSCTSYVWAQVEENLSPQ